ncbi:MAG: ATP-dependent sacrificial sulfur transferase LarE [Chloroflexota bacterium]
MTLEIKKLSHSDILKHLKIDELEPELRTKTERLVALLEEMEAVLVAYSGGVDSALLLKVVHEVLGPTRGAGCLAISPSIPPREITLAQNHAAAMGVQLLLTHTTEMEREGYVENSPQRCYFCKNTLFTELHEIARREGFRFIVDGFNLDDKGDYRPGMRAAKELEIRSPLAESGFTKKDIRALSKLLGLPTWNKPAAACLSSRIPYGSPVTVEALERIGKAEEFLQDLGFAEVRVRHYNDMARIEVPSAELDRFVEEKTRQAVSSGLHALGYTYVTLDLDGYRSGSLNEVILVKRK